MLNAEVICLEKEALCETFEHCTVALVITRAADNIFFAIFTGILLVTFGFFLWVSRAKMTIAEWKIRQIWQIMQEFTCLVAMTTVWRCSATLKYREIQNCFSLSIAKISKSCGDARVSSKSLAAEMFSICCQLGYFNLLAVCNQPY